jgi:hypothetical protein
VGGVGTAIVEVVDGADGALVVDAEEVVGERRTDVVVADGPPSVLALHVAARIAITTIEARRVGRR